MPELGIQLYSVRDFMKSEDRIKYTFGELARYGYTEVQTAGMPIPYEAFAKIAADAGLKVCGTHSPWSLFEDMDECIRVHKVLGTTNAGVGGMPHIFDGVIPLETVKNFAEDVKRIAKILAENGMKFTYHHHAREFSKIDGDKTIMDIFLSEFDPETVSIVADTYWLQHAGVSVTDWIEEHGDRIDILHLKDKNVPLGKSDGAITELGNGNINFKKVIDVAKKKGITHFCYEQDYGWEVDPLESAKQSAEYIKQFVL
jgi:sugar phosphate isomerase/epimerase